MSQRLHVPSGGEPVDSQAPAGSQQVSEHPAPVDRGVPIPREPSAGTRATADVPPDGTTGTARGLDRVRRDPYLLISALLVLLGVAFAIRQPWSGDLGMHAATVDRLRANLAHPGNPLVAENTPSPYYSPYTVLLALAARAFGVSSLTVLWVAGVINLVLVLWGIRAFTRVFSKRPAAGVLALLFVLGLWGLRPRVWSGFFSFWALPLVMPFPSTLALGLMLLFWAGLAATLDRRPAAWRYLGLGLLAATTALVHQFTFVIMVFGALALVAARARRLPRGAWAWLSAAAVEGVVVLLVWPYYSFFSLLGVNSLNSIHKPLYEQPWLYYGLIVVALPALWLRVRRDLLDPMVVLFVLSVALVAYGAVTGRYEFGRTWPGVMLAAQFALALEMARVLPPWVGVRNGGFRACPPGLLRPWVGVTALACVLGLAIQGGNLLYLVPSSMVPAGITRAMYKKWPDYSWIARYIRPGDTVLTDNYYAIRAIPAYGALTVAPAWPDPMLPDQAARWHAIAVMIDHRTSESARLAELKRYHVRWILETPGKWSIDAGRTPVAVGPDGQRLYLAPTAG